LRSDDFPAPDGPIIAVNSPQLKRPETPLRTVFVSKKTQLFNQKSSSILKSVLGQIIVTDMALCSARIEKITVRGR